jgi:hypothetical protein
MCEDCRLIAEEYQQLLTARTRALVQAQDEAERLTRELANMKRRADMYEQISKAGMPDVILAWMDKEIDTLLRQPLAAPNVTDA